MSVRDPLSVAYDSRARYVLLRAIKAHQESKGGSSGVAVFVTSPAGEFRNLDRGGRTHHERAFQNALYRPVFSEPRRRRELPVWSLKVTWGPVRFRGGRWGRQATARLYRYGSGYRHAAARPRWTAGETFRSAPGARIDQ
jgi:hypothetical protein